MAALQLLQRQWDLEDRLKALGKGVGDTPVSIFLRDMREVWSKADPKPTPLVKMAMEELGVNDVKRFSESRNLNLTQLETALTKMVKNYIKKGRKIKIEI